MVKPAVFLVLGLVLFFTNVSIGEAATSCPPNIPGTEQNHTVYSESQVKGKGEELVSKADLCSDESVTVKTNYTFGFKTSGSVIVGTTRACTDADKKKKTYGCETGQIPPKLCIVLPDGKTAVTVSKCDREALTKAFNDSIDNKTAKPLTQLAEDLAESTDSNGVLTAIPDRTLTNALNDAFGEGLSTSAKQEIGDSSAGERIVELARAGKFEEAAQAAETAKLSPDTISQIKSMHSTKRPDTPLVPTPTGGSQPQNTFGGLSGGLNGGSEINAANLDRAKCAIATIESGSCGGNYGAVGPRTNKGNRAYGKYQVMDFNVPSWTREVLGQALTPQQFLNSPEAQEKVFEQKFSQLASQYGGYENASKVWFGGPKALRNPNASDGGTTVAKYAARFSQLFEGAIPFGGTAGIYKGGSSPLGNLNPFNLFGGGGEGGVNRPGSGGVAGSGSPVGSSGGYATPASAPAQQSGQVSPVQQFLQTIGIGTQAPKSVQAVAAIIAQPKEVKRGESLTLSWSSVGTNPATPCQVLLTAGTSTTVIARGNEGTEILDTSAAEIGEWDFTLRCTAYANSESIEKKAATLIK